MPHENERNLFLENPEVSATFVIVRIILQIYSDKAKVWATTGWETTGLEYFHACYELETAEVADCIFRERR